ncbi:hypothetical protein [Anaerotignum propionicum]|uniref:hypothetical protein n=1 Tax=Anaerotignum propionicum TaxID=28446 RepID=UPI00210A62DD|nr:hypothetical protein [Anaerotignum propionicum]MCQ4935954.1 hypothetical protein [Anaerotignum propionicum]
MKKLIIILLCIGLFILTACQDKVTKLSSSLDGTQSDELSAGIPSMKKMDLSSMEEFYLSAFTNGMKSDVYLLEHVDEYKFFTATLYYLQDNQWVKQSNFKADIKNEKSFLAIDYSNLFCPKIAFKSGNEVKRLTTSSENFKSQYDELTWDIDISNSIMISEKEIPIIAYRNSDINGTIHKANLEDFYSLENLLVNKNEEYAILTVKISN